MENNRNFDQEQNKIPEANKNVNSPEDNTTPYRTELEVKQQADEENDLEDNALKDIKDPDLRKTIDKLPPETDLQTHPDLR